jgi:hypothetical protein
VLARNRRPREKRGMTLGTWSHEWRLRRDFNRLPRECRAELLRVLAAPTSLRADVIMRFHERTDGKRVAENLMDLEANDPLRLRMIGAIERSLRTTGKDSIWPHFPII